MNKSVIMTFTIIFMLVGSYLPVLLGDDIFSLWTVFGGFVGGIFGVWLGVSIAKRF